MDRHLLKRVLYEPAKEFPAEVKDKLMAITKRENSALRQTIETEISKLLEKEFGSQVDPDFTILHT